MNVKASGSARLPIDHFFRSLAEDQKDRAVSIILSGTGTDGTLGLKAIKGHSGMTMVQSVHSAKYGGMPQSAMMTDLVDYVLPVGEMPQKLLSYAKAHYLTGGQQSPIAYNHSPEGLEKIYILLRSHTGNDFSNYKVGTIRRRIDRRMNVHQLETTKHYLRFLQENPTEIEVLFRELLIGVTSFFRDSSGFEALGKHVESHVLDSKSKSDNIRVWVSGCASGEEAYSIGIILQEIMERRKRHNVIQIFATDLDKQGIEAARTGMYPEGIVADVSSERLARFFTKEERGYQINKEIRDMIIFAPHNLIVDPPFTKLDILSCRNLLIYLDADLQRRLMPLFHYALRPNGLLFLGSSESLAGFGDYFTALDKKWKLFEKKEGALPPYLQKKFLFQSLPEPSPKVEGLPITRAEKERGISVLAQKVLLDRHAPPSVIVNEQGDIAYIHGRTGRFLEPASGRPTTNLFDMAREGLRLEVASAIREAASHDQEVVHTGIQVKTDGGVGLVDVNVKKITELTTLQGLFVVTFVAKSTGEPSSAGKVMTSLRKMPKGQEQVLSKELQYTKERLQRTIEELETSNEELKSMNEELQSTNEELQSTNEELETAREEMQSLNEELQMVNAELQMRVDDLSHTYDDMQNLLNSTDIATIFLDHQLSIKQFTPQAKKVINLLESDVGRSIGDLASKLKHENLVDDAQEVLRTLIFKEADVQARDGSWYLMRITPYRTTTNKIEGLVMTFVEISKLKQADEMILKANQTLAMQKEELARQNDSFVQAFGEIVYVHDVSGNEIKWGGGYSRVLGYSEEEMGNDRESWLGKVHPDDYSLVVEEFERAKAGNQIYDSEYRFRRQDSSYLWIHDRGVMHFDKGVLVRVIGIMRDVTERQQAMEKVQQSEAYYRTLVDCAPFCIHEIDLNGKFLSVNPAGLQMMNISDEQQLIGVPYLDAVAQEDRDQVQALLSNACQGTSSEFEFQVAGEGPAMVIASNFIPRKGPDGITQKVMGISQDITERKQAERELAKQSNFLRHVIDIIPNFVFAKDRVGQFILANQAVAKVYGTTVEELLGKSDADFNPNSKEVEFFRQKDLMVMDSAKDVFIPEEVITDPTGKPRWFQTVKRPLIGEDGKAYAVLGVATDITERKQAEQALRENLE